MRRLIFKACRGDFIRWLVSAVMRQDLGLIGTSKCFWSEFDFSGSVILTISSILIGYGWIFSSADEIFSTFYWSSKFLISIKSIFLYVKSSFWFNFLISYLRSKITYLFHYDFNAHFLRIISLIILALNQAQFFLLNFQFCLFSQISPNSVLYGFVSYYPLALSSRIRFCYQIQWSCLKFSFPDSSK